MAITATSQASELAFREADGLEVALLWDTRSSEVSIELLDCRTETALAFVVDPKSALDAFYHPFAYAPVTCSELEDTPELAGLKELTWDKDGKVVTGADGAAVLATPKNPATMRQLMSHTAGFGYGLTLAKGMIVEGSAEYVLVIGVERLSDLTDLEDRATAFLFGDGAGAVVVGPSDVPAIGPTVWGSEGD